MENDKSLELGLALDDLRIERRKAFQSQTREIWATTRGRESISVGQAKELSLRALEENARGWIADSIERISAMTRAPDAFAKLNEALAHHLSDLRLDFARSCQHATYGVSKGLDGNEFANLRDHLDRQLEAHRHRFLPISSADVQDAKSRPGRKPIYDWPEATSFIWGRLFRGDIKPKIQAEIEREYLSYFAAKLGKEPSLSIARPHAERIWREINREA